MSKAQDKTIDKWIDLSELPRDNRNMFQWVKSVGCNMKFKYGDVVGTLKILEYCKIKHTVKIFIENYTNSFGYTIETCELVRCNLGGVIRKNILVNAPNLIQYLANKEDALYSLGSNTKIDLVCPICGYVKPMRVVDFTKSGFSCNRCGDGVSYANKFMLCLLEQLNCNFEPEISKNTHGYEWMDNYRYDFLLVVNKINYLIEMDGAFHFRENSHTSSSLEERKLVDLHKNKIAKEHNCIVLRINCDYDKIQNRYNTIKNNILQSNLKDILNLNSPLIDWDKCDYCGCASWCVKVCEYWNNGINSTSEIAKIMKINSETVRRYLKVGAQNGLCDYDPKIALINSQHKIGCPIVVYTDDNQLSYTFRDINDLIRSSLKIFGKQFNRSSIYTCCEGRTKYAYGYNMKYITIDEYELAHRTIQNEYNLQEVNVLV